MQKLLKGEALVSRPNIKAEIRLFGMDESISMDEIREAVANEGRCKPEEVNVGKIGRTRTGAGVVWVRCPKVSAVTIADKQRIQIGWTSVRVERDPLAHGAIAHQPDSTRKIDTIPDSAPTR